MAIDRSANGLGYVRAVFSPRWKGHAAPLELIRAHVRAVARCAEACPMDAELRRLEMRGRVGAAFADYLVSDFEPFTAKRVQHRPLRDRIAMTGRGPWQIDLQANEFSTAHGALDAPTHFAAGAMYSYVGADGFSVRLPALGVRR